MVGEADHTRAAGEEPCQHQVSVQAHLQPGPAPQQLQEAGGGHGLQQHLQTVQVRGPPRPFLLSRAVFHFNFFSGDPFFFYYKTIATQFTIAAYSTVLSNTYFFHTFFFLFSCPTGRLVFKGSIHLFGEPIKISCFRAELNLVSYDNPIRTLCLFREENALVEQFVFEVLVVFVESLALAHSDDRSVGNVSHFLILISLYPKIERNV